MKTDITGVILAGGQSRRFGSPKAFAKRNNTPFYMYSYQVLQHFTDSIILVTNPVLYPAFSEENTLITVVNDEQIYRGQGPLAGIYTAMDKISTNWYMILPIDVPYINKEVMGKLVSYIESKADAIVPIVNGRQQPLIAIYNKKIKNRLNECLETGQRSMQALLATCNVKYVEINNDTPFININSKDEYEKYID